MAAEYVLNTLMDISISNWRKTMRPTMAQAHLKDGFIYGDDVSQEYVYMPAGEIGLSNPMCVYENNGVITDVDFAEAEKLITLRSLKVTSHPTLGSRSC